MFSLELFNSGSAFNDRNAEIARILRDVADKIENNRMTTDLVLPVRDINGNKCGEVYLVDQGDQDHE